MPELMQENFIAILQSHLNHMPNKQAFVFLDDVTTIGSAMTFAELDEAAKKTAVLLQKTAQPGDTVIIMMPPGLEYITALYGCFYAGLIAVPVNPPQPNNLTQELLTLKNIIQSAQAKTILTVDAIHSLFKSANDNALAQLTIYDTKQSLTYMSNAWRCPEFSAEQIAIILYTSGSTGNPKGVMISHGNLIHNIRCFAQHCQKTAEDSVCTWLPINTIAGIYTRLFGSIIGGTTFIFSPLKFLENPVFWLQAIAHHQTTISAAPNFAYDYCVQAAQEEQLAGLNLSQWTMAISGGEMVRQETMERFTNKFAPYGFKRAAFFPYYGLTESLCIAVPAVGDPAIQKISRHGLNQHKINSPILSDEDAAYFVANGQCFYDTDVKIVNPITKNKCASDEIGEIWVASISNAKGYWHNSTLTQDIFQAYTADTNEGPYLRTGDLGFIKDQQIYVTGRYKELIIIRGKNYYPEEIENCVLQHCRHYQVTACAGFAIEQHAQEKLVLVLEVKQPLAKSTEEELITTVIKTVNQFIGINVDDLVILDNQKIPRTATQKVKRLLCQQYYHEGRWPSVNKQLANIDMLNVAPATIVLEQLLKLPLPTQQQTVLTFLQTLFTQILRKPIADSLLTKPIAEFGIDSIQSVRLITELKNKLKVSLSHAIFYDDTTLTKLSNKLLQQINGITSNDLTKINYEHEIKELEQLIPTHLPILTNHCKALLLTGATGFLGSYLLHDLLQSTDCQIYCLVRAETIAQAEQRLLAILSKGSGWQPAFAQRIQPILGSLTEKNFGLTDEQFQHLTTSIHAIIHNGADVNFVAPYTTLKSTNVDSLLTIVKLACTAQLKPIHFVSTLAVFNSPERYRFATIQEQDHISEPHSLYSGYAQTKWVAEHILQKAKSKGVPVSIYRPGLITGDSNNGYCNTDDLLCRFIKGCLQLSEFPDLNIEIDMVPVDYVSQAIAHLVKTKLTTNNIYHLTNPRPILLKTLINWLSNYGFAANAISFSAWQNKINQNLSSTNALYPISTFLSEQHPVSGETILDLLNDKSLNFSTTQTRENLAGSDINYQGITNDLLKCYIAFFIKSGFFADIPLLLMQKKTEQTII
jgi:thioester reductase-like protein